MSEEQNMGSQPAKPCLLKGNEGACDLEALERLVDTRDAAVAAYCAAGPSYAERDRLSGAIGDRNREVAELLAENARALISSAREAVQLRAALVALRDAVKAEPVMNHMKYDQLGIQVNAALSGGPGHGTGSTLEDAVRPQNPSAREAGRLREALQNLMGIYDTPLSRRRFPPDDFMNEALETARAALSTETGNQS